MYTPLGDSTYGNMWETADLGMILNTGGSMGQRTRDQLLSDLSDLRESYAKAIEMIENQQGQLSLALTVLAELGFDLADFAEML